MMESIPLDRVLLMVFINELSDKLWKLEKSLAKKVYKRYTRPVKSIFSSEVGIKVEIQELTDVQEQVKSLQDLLIIRTDAPPFNSEV